jgi:hypothetical protein
VSAGLAGEGRLGGLAGRRLRRLHAVVDATEMTLRLVVATSLVRAVGGALVITDRTPLDALVKHDPHPRSLARRWYLGLAARYGTVLWLDADAATLAARDAEHSAADLAAVRARYWAWARRLPNAVRLDTGASAPAGVCEAALERLAR